jgi:hypothetical protein
MSDDKHFRNLLVAIQSPGKDQRTGLYCCFKIARMIWGDEIPHQPYWAANVIMRSVVVEKVHELAELKARVEGAEFVPLVMVSRNPLSVIHVMVREPNGSQGPPLGWKRDCDGHFASPRNVSPYDAEHHYDQLCYRCGQRAGIEMPSDRVVSRFRAYGLEPEAEGRGHVKLSVEDAASLLDRLRTC